MTVYILYYFLIITESVPEICGFVQAHPRHNSTRGLTMRNNSITAAALAALILCAVTLALAAPDPGTKDKDKFDIENAGSLTGRIILEDGSPMPYGIVAFFEDVGGSGEHQDYGATKRAPMMIAFIREDGRFETPLFPAGKYFLGALMQKRWVGGAPARGQKRFSAFDKDGTYRIFEVQAAEKTDIGTVTVREPNAFPGLKKRFSVSGRVIDDEGKGVAGAVVVVKKDINDPKGVFISPETDDKGAYRLEISPGRYFFVARKTLTRAGRPKPGDLMGTLGQTRPIGIGGKSEQPAAYIIGNDGDEFTDVDIVMFPIPVPEKKREEIEAKVKARKLDKNSLPDDLPLMKQKVEKTQPSEHQPR